VRYRVSNGRVVRYASPPLGDRGRCRRAARRTSVDGWSAAPMMQGVGSIDAKLYVPRVGWTTNLQTARRRNAQNNMR
jgi:general secretion pathway protein J